MSCINNKTMSFQFRHLINGLFHFTYRACWQFGYSFQIFYQRITSKQTIPNMKTNTSIGVSLGYEKMYNGACKRYLITQRFNTYYIGGIYCKTFV